MKIMLAAIGRLKDSGERELFERYSSRFDAAGRAMSLGPLQLFDFLESRASEPTVRKAEEGQRLNKATAGADFRIALDEGGTLDASVDFARRLARLRDQGIPALGFMIGGPDGLSDEARASANAVLSLGRMTLPHGLARVVLAEQLYRTVTILSGHPYHRA